MPANRTRARKDWKEHKLNSWFFLGILTMVVLALCAIGVRFLKPPTVVSLLLTTVVIQTIIFLNSGKLVVWLTGCEMPDAQQQARLLPLLQSLVERSPLSRTPTLYIAKMDAPNAFAFGTGLMSASGIAVTKELIELLEDDELECVLAHELGHIVSRDTALMTVIAIMLAALHRLTRGLTNIGRLALVGALVLELVAYVPRVVAAGITQLREYAADAYSAYLTGQVQPMIRAFEKMQAWYASQADKKRNPLDMLRRPPMDELLLSHPDMHSRITMLQQLEEE